MNVGAGRAFGKAFTINPTTINIVGKLGFHAGGTPSVQTDPSTDGNPHTQSSASTSFLRHVPHAHSSPISRAELMKRHEMPFTNPRVYVTSTTQNKSPILEQVLKHKSQIFIPSLTEEARIGPGAATNMSSPAKTEIRPRFSIPSTPLKPAFIASESQNIDMPSSSTLTSELSPIMNPGSLDIEEIPEGEKLIPDWIYMEPSVAKTVVSEAVNIPTADVIKTAALTSQAPSPSSLNLLFGESSAAEVITEAANVASGLKVAFKPSTIESMEEGTFAGGSSILNSIIGIFTSIGSGMRGLMTSIWDLVTSLFTDACEAAKNAAVAAGEGIVNGLNEGGSFLMEKMDNFMFYFISRIAFGIITVLIILITADCIRSSINGRLDDKHSKSKDNRRNRIMN